MKYSFCLFHGQSFRWFIRCDAASLETLRQDPTLSLSASLPTTKTRVGNREFGFAPIAVAKVDAIADAWTAGHNRVALVDADLLFLAPIMDTFCVADGGLALAPNYYPHNDEHLAPIHGYFNSGFLVTCAESFHSDWRQTLLSRPWTFTDQACLNDVATRYKVTMLGPEANVGFWRSRDWRTLRFEPLPDGASLIHCHFFQRLRTRADWVDRTFALHCLKSFVGVSEKHEELLALIVDLDESGWYRSSLALS